MPFEPTKNLQKIIAVLVEEPEGLWIREIARRTGLRGATVTYFVNKHPDMFDEQNIEASGKKYFRLVKLKQGAFTKRGAILSRILQDPLPARFYLHRHTQNLRTNWMSQFVTLF